MLEKPDFPDDRIDAILRADYGVTPREIEFLPIGYDSASSVYRVTAADAVYFLKLRRGNVPDAALVVPHMLKSRGIEQVVAPLPTRSDALSVQADDYTLILYPHIDGDNAMVRGLTEAQWIEFGAVLRRIHATELTPEMLKVVERETFEAHGGRERIRRFQDYAETLTDADPIAVEMAALWREKRDDLTRLVNRADALARQLQARRPEFVLCHSDVHIANVLVSDDGRIFIVDWDQPLLAPKERDLMFVLAVTGSIAVSEADQARFLRGYGATQIDPAVLAYYRTDWAVQDAGENSMTAFGLRDSGEETRLDALRMMRAMFGPGGAI